MREQRRDPDDIAVQAGTYEACYRQNYQLNMIIGDAATVGVYDSTINRAWTDSREEELDRAVMTGTEAATAAAMAAADPEWFDLGDRRAYP